MLPPRFKDWFAARGWTVRSHQLALVEAAARKESVLLVAPTGGGKTLAGFLPTLIALAEQPKRPRARTLHTLYISPLKALAVDVARNLDAPIADMDLPVSVETRTGDTPAALRARQRHTPPDIMLTTPEQLGLLLAHPRADKLFAGLKTVVLDELHALTIPSAATCWRWGWRGWPTWRRGIAGSACPRRWLIPGPCSVS